MKLSTKKKYSEGLCSVVCTTYNHAKYSRAAIKSILKQDYRPIEIIIVDDGSTDGNAQAVQEALSSCSVPYTFITQPNCGNVAQVSNRALEAANGEYIVMLALDDLLLPKCISSKIAMMIENPSLVLVGNSSINEIDDKGEVISACKQCPIFGKENASPKEMLELEYDNLYTFFLQGAAFKAEFIEDLGKFDEAMAGDDLIFRTKMWLHFINNTALNFSFLSYPGFAYRKHSQNLHRNGNRQLRTVVEWRNRFYPDRPLPPMVQKWAVNYIARLIEAHDHSSLDALLTYDAQLEDIFDEYRISWKYKRRRVKNFFKKVFLI